MNGTETDLMNRLSEPFPPSEVKWKCQVVRGNRALAVAYVDARVVEDRLDAVLGPGGWQDSYTVLPNNSVVCTLKVRIGSEWIEKSDVGSQSDQPDEGDRMKSAFSDALKRAAVKLGVGRYLYRVDSQWVDYDTQTRQLKGKPKLPAWALPGGKPVADQDKKTGGITREQWETIKAELAKHGTEQSLFLKAFGVNDKKPGRLQAAQYETMLQVAQAGAGELAKKLEANGKVGAA